MSFQPPNYAKKPRKQIRSTWVVAILAVLLLVSALSTGEGGFGMWILLMGLLILVTSVYALVFRRASWARLSSPTVRKRAVAVGGAVTIAGFVIAGLTLPPTEKTVEPVAGTSATPTATKTSTPTPTKTTAAVAAGKACVSAGARETVSSATATPTATPTSTATRTATPTPTASSSTAGAGQAAVFICTEDDKGKLVWMDEESSTKIVAERKEAAEKEASDKKAAEEAAAAEQKRIADEQAAAEAQRVADEKAAADAEAQRVADEQARQQQYVAPAPAPAAPAPVAPAPAPAPGAVHPGSFCSPGGAAGATSKGTPMVCAPGSDGRLRWRSA